MTSSLSTSTRVLNTMSAISSWLPVPRSTGWMLGRKSEMRATRSVVLRRRLPRAADEAAPTGLRTRLRRTVPRRRGRRSRCRRSGGRCRRRRRCGAPRARRRDHGDRGQDSRKTGFHRSPPQPVALHGQCLRILQPDCACVNLLQYSMNNARRQTRATSAGSGRAEGSDDDRAESAPGPADPCRSPARRDRRRRPSRERRCSSSTA